MLTTAETSDAAATTSMRNELVALADSCLQLRGSTAPVLAAHEDGHVVGSAELRDALHIHRVLVLHVLFKMKQMHRKREN